MKTYAEWFDIARVVRTYREGDGKSYRSGVERAAALSAVKAQEAGLPAIDAVALVFEGYENLPPISPDPYWAAARLAPTGAFA